MAYSYAYDAMGRMKEKTVSGRRLLAFAYDKNGNQIRQTDVTGKITEYRFDLLDRLTEVWDDGEKLVEYGYYPDGTIQRELHGPLKKEYAYDADRNLTGLSIQCGDSLLADTIHTMRSTAIPGWKHLTGIFRSTTTMRKVSGQKWKKTDAWQRLSSTLQRKLSQRQRTELSSAISGAVS